MNGARHRWAWLVSGVVLDLASTATCLPVADASLSLSLHRRELWLWHTGLIGCTLTFVHAVVLPRLIWLDHRLTIRQCMTAFALSLATPLLGFFSVCVGFGTGIAAAISFAGAVEFWDLLSGPTASSGSRVLFFGAAGAGYVAGGAICSGLSVWFAGAMFKQPEQIAPRIRTAVFGGGTAALLLAALTLRPTLKWLPYADTSYGLESSQPIMLLALVGVPHLLLTCRDMAHHPPALAAFPVAARRLCVLLALLWGSGALLLAVAYGRS